jgi:hypothetical protein
MFGDIKSLGYPSKGVILSNHLKFVGANKSILTSGSILISGNPYIGVLLYMEVGQDLDAEEVLVGDNLLCLLIGFMIAEEDSGRVSKSDENDDWWQWIALGLKKNGDQDDIFQRVGFMIMDRMQAMSEDAVVRRVNISKQFD